MERAAYLERRGWEAGEVSDLNRRLVLTKYALIVSASTTATREVVITHNPFPLNLSRVSVICLPFSILDI